MDKQKPQSGPTPTAPSTQGKPTPPPRTGPAPQVTEVDGSPAGSKKKK